MNFGLTVAVPSALSPAGSLAVTLPRHFRPGPSGAWEPLTAFAPKNNRLCLVLSIDVSDLSVGIAGGRVPQSVGQFGGILYYVEGVGNSVCFLATDESLFQMLNL